MYLYMYMYVCVNMHLHIYQKYDEEHMRKKFHVHNVSPQYTKFRVLLPLGEGQGLEIQVMVKGILAKSKMFYFFLKQWLATYIKK